MDFPNDLLMEVVIASWIIGALCFLQNLPRIGKVIFIHFASFVLAYLATLYYLFTFDVRELSRELDSLYDSPTEMVCVALGNIVALSSLVAGVVMGTGLIW